MHAVVVACPHCGKALKLSDRSKLGKRAKCPACQTPFVLQESDPPSTVAELPRPPAVSREDAPSPSTLERAETTVLVDSPDQKRVADQKATDFTGETPPVAEAPPRPAEPSEGFVVRVSEEVSPLAELRRRRQRRSRTGLWTGLIILVLGAGAGAFVAMNWKPSPADSPSTDPAPDQLAAGAAQATLVSLRREELESRPELVDEFRPTRGQPIQLYLMPSGVNAVLHLRPRELWSNDVQMQVLRASLTEGVVQWLESFLRTHCRREPAQIEEALFGVIMGAKGTPPMMAVVVQLAEDAKRSDLVTEFRGDTVLEREGLRINETAEFTYVLQGNRTIAICPKSLGTELRESINTPNHYCSEGLLHLLPYTDRERLCTLVFDVTAVRRHEDVLFPEETRAAFDAVLLWFGDEVETVAWSLHVDPEFLHSQMLLRTSPITSPTRLRQVIRNRLDSAPRELMELGRLMNPQRVGFRQIIGRFPAMMEGYRQATVINVGDRHVRLTTLLPAKAAPNLALGIMLTWKESTLTDFSAGPPVIVATQPDQPLSLEERLQREVDAEFNREPLESALNFIGASISAKIYLDGDALEAAGYTRNMQQTFNLGRVPASVVLSKIVSQYPGMVVSIDQAADEIRVTTEPAATDQGRPIHPLPPAPE